MVAREIYLELEMQPLKMFEAKHGFNGELQQFFTERVFVYAEPYTPKLTGNFIRNTHIGEDYIHYLSPQSLYLWHGKKMIDPKYRCGGIPIIDKQTGIITKWISRKGVQKVVTDIDLNFNGSPLRGPYWLNRMWVDKSKEITKEVQGYIEGKLGGKND